MSKLTGTLHPPPTPNLQKKQEKEHQEGIVPVSNLCLYVPTLQVSSHINLRMDNMVTQFGYYTSITFFTLSTLYVKLDVLGGSRAIL